MLGLAMDKEEFVTALREVLNEQRHITDDEHQLQHAWLSKKMYTEQKWDARWEKAAQSAIGVVVVAVLSGLGWIGNLIINALKDGP